MQIKGILFCSIPTFFKNFGAAFFKHWLVVSYSMIIFHKAFVKIRNEVDPKPVRL